MAAVTVAQCDWRDDAMGLLMNPWVILAVVIGLGISHWQAYSYGRSNGAAAVEVAVARARAEAEQRAAARNRKVAEDLRVLVDIQTQARERAEAESEELRNALAADHSDTTVRVGPELDRLFSTVLYGSGDRAATDPGG